MENKLEWRFVGEGEHGEWLRAKGRDKYDRAADHVFSTVGPSLERLALTTHHMAKLQYRRARG